MPTTQQAPPPKPESVPLGDGLAAKAKLAIRSRQRRIDEAVEQASR